MGRWVFDGIGYATRKQMCQARRDRYVELIRDGMNYTRAAKAVGVSKRTGKVWRNGRTRTTGRNEKPSATIWYRPDMDETKTINPRFLDLESRLHIADWTGAGWSIRRIASRLGRAASSISREIARNTNPDTGMYEPNRAQRVSMGRRARPKAARVRSVPGLLDYIRDGLKRHWSPEQIAGRLREDFPHNEDMHICTETIYQAIYVQARGELREEVSRALRTGRTVRRPRTGESERRPRFREPMVMISERPPEVADRAVPGHWEGDLICGRRNKTAIGTLVERSTRFTILLHLPDGHDAEHVQRAVIERMRDLPKLLRNSLTWDQGSELALHRRISTALDMAVYFCDPHSPWQRGTNENTNGLLRQYFPKGTDLGGYSQKYLDAVAEELNDRPRKILGFRKPSEAILDLINTT
ncbi:IS30 family transposase [Bifidobacterium imperatoris]|uniref:Transposase n=2 Tax=Bifidobacterium imperatoris TaxID=2020965 RepID=A0A2N5IV16_9BIFI|nr:transposase [Bifidobacterium imperatoris]QSY57900.1 IS30 family transposase [Bifidobacterium imperatoris]